MMTRTIGTTLFALLCAAALDAQAPAQRPRVGYAGTVAAPPPPQVVVAPPVYYVPGGLALGGLPFFVLTDGSVAVNFGNGYERVLRPCAVPRANAARTDARDALGRILPPPGIAALQPGTRGTVTSALRPANQVSCYSADSGRLTLR